jgi:serine/threonine-protein kinase
MGGEVKLADFGVAKAADGREATRSNLVKGKLSYMAPELLRGVPASHASDIFLAGALLFELLAGRKLFQNESTPEKVLATIAAHDERSVSLPAGSVPELLPVVQRALARDPAQRYPHARELAAALKAIIARRGWVVGPEVIAAKLAALFPDRKPFGLESGAGVPLRDDATAAKPASGHEPLAGTAAASSAAPQAPRLGASGNAAAPRPGSKPGAEPAKGAPTAPRTRKRLGEMMVEAGLITQGQLQHLMSRQRLEGGRIGELAVTLDYTSARAVLELLGKQLHVPFISDEKILQVTPPPELLSRFGEDMALRLLALPIGEKDGMPYIAMTEPADLARIDMIRFRLGQRIQPVVCTELGVRRAISRFFGNRSEEHKWRQLDPSDPLALLTGRMVDFDEQGRVVRTGETSGSTPINAMSLPAITPAAGFTPATPPSLGGTTPAPNAAFAYVVSGVGPDGRPILVAVPLSSLQVQAGTRPASEAAGEPAAAAGSKQDSEGQKRP